MPLTSLSALSALGLASLTHPEAPGGKRGRSPNGKLVSQDPGGGWKEGCGRTLRKKKDADLLATSAVEACRYQRFGSHGLQKTTTYMALERLEMLEPVDMSSL